MYYTSKACQPYDLRLVALFRKGFENLPSISTSAESGAMMFFLNVKQRNDWRF
jgi:hypothetical protein